MCGRAVCCRSGAVLRKRRLRRVDDLVEHLDADQRVFVRRVAMEKLVLHQAGQRTEFREEPAEKAELVHVAQRAADLSLAR